jgi:hypothetical protein
LLLSLLQFNEIALLLALDSWLYFGTHWPTKTSNE